MLTPILPCEAWKESIFLVAGLQACITLMAAAMPACTRMSLCVLDSMLGSTIPLMHKMPDPVASGVPAVSPREGVWACLTHAWRIQNDQAVSQRDFVFMLSYYHIQIVMHPVQLLGVAFDAIKCARAAGQT